MLSTVLRTQLLDTGKYRKIPVITPRLLSWLITEGTSQPRRKIGGL